MFKLLTKLINKYNEHLKKKYALNDIKRAAELKALEEENDKIAQHLASLTVRITHAAVQLPGGKVSLGKTHAEAMAKLSLAERMEITDLRTRQGFLTSTGHFVSRLQATDIAFEAGQLLEEHYNLIGGGELISENLWEYGCYGYDPVEGYSKKEEIKA